MDNNKELLEKMLSELKSIRHYVFWGYWLLAFMLIGQSCNSCAKRTQDVKCQCVENAGSSEK